MKNREDVLARIREYYEEEFPESDPTIKDAENIGLAHTYLEDYELPDEHRTYFDACYPVQLSLNLETRTVTIYLADKLVDSHTFTDYDELYEWVDCFEFENVFSLKI